MNEQVRRRSIERHCAATIRALAGHPEAEYRRQLLFDGARGINLYSPHLAIDVVTDSIDRCRGVADAMALRLLYTDDKAHRSLMPEGEVAAMVFDILEQLRVESLAPEGLKGVRHNLDAAFEAWCQQSLNEKINENELGLLIFSVIQITRTRLSGLPQDEQVEDIIESTRFKLSPMVGVEFSQLRSLRFDQQAYAKNALKIALCVGEIAHTLDGEALDHQTASVRQRLMMPRQHEADERYIEGGAAGTGKTEAETGTSSYRVYCREFDREVTGREILRDATRRQLREQLDRLVQAQAVSIPRLAQRLKRLFAVQDQAGWNFGEDEGYLDGRRLGQLVANPAYTRIFRQHRLIPRCETVVSFLIDNSGSMKRQRYEAVAVLVDIYTRALDLAGIASEVLGFTTGGWTGGQSINRWREQGMPENPGRLNDRLHVVYKDANSSWRRARDSIASLMSTHHFREGLDGEALEWAAARLRTVNTERRCLIMISDGAPMDSATNHHNDDGILERHLHEVIQRLEKDPDIELRGVGIDLDLDEFFAESLVMDLTGTLGNSDFRALETLYGHRRFR